MQSEIGANVYVQRESVCDSMVWSLTTAIAALFQQYYSQARSQDLKKGGAILKEWEVCIRRWLEFSLTLNQFQTVCPKFETKCLGNIGNSKVFSAQN